MSIGSFFGKLLGADKVVGKVVDAGTDLTKTFSNKEQASRRHQADMDSDYRFAKFIRPFIALWISILYIALFICEIFGIKIDSSHFSTIQTLLMLIISFYFPARTIEKIMKAKLKDKKKDPGKDQDQN